ncbi:MAG: double zinc ribbon domain-containing protein [Methanobacteriaceae archaeon]
MSNECEKCGTVNNNDSKFCEKCGKALDSINHKSNTINNVDCPFCSQKIPMNSKKCNYCGKRLDGNRGIGIPTIILIVILIFLLLNFIAAILISSI